MKRFILLGGLFYALTIMAFANGNLEAFGGMPLNWENSNISGQSISVSSTSVGLGLGFISPITEKVAFGVLDEFILPMSFKTTTGGTTKTADRSDYDSLMGMSVSLGSIFYLYSNEDDTIKIPLFVGLRWMWLSSSTTYVSTFGNNFGIEAGIGGEYHINQKFYAFVRAMLIYDFYSMSTITTGYGSTSVSGVISSFGITPQLGLGISF
jgi:hypothetical protein